MIRKFKFTIFFVLCFFFITAACVSVSLGSKNGKSYDNIFFNAPADPYSELKVQSADRSWQNTKNGNTISYMSNCEQTSEPTLEVLSSIALDGVEDLKIVEKKKINYNGREALNTVLLGRVDGIPIQADLTVLKKNNCIFNITYIGSIHTYMSDLSIFKKFWKDLTIK
ncbi:MAG: hypothetical protein A4S09_00135 [Proteobacteria bacterium SG_bin7]|nr:MAG: hypothetical protein A4S09_00135 [Proteobacteria bacterium SG_bin7]